MDSDTIFFYDQVSDRVKEEHIFLNNFAATPITINGLEFKTVEHYYQASKFKGEQFEAVRHTSTPDEAKKLAHSYRNYDENWEEKKESVMIEALRAKFDQNPELKERLVLTGEKRLVEDSERDLYWGGAVEGSKNRLGIMLEELRAEYRNR